MTKEKRVVFEPSDIRRVSFECKKCGGAMTTGADRFRFSGTQLDRCPSCGADWDPFPTTGDPYRTFMEALAHVVRDLKENQRFTIRLELDATPPAEHT